MRYRMYLSNYHYFIQSYDGPLWSKHVAQLISCIIKTMHQTVV